MHASIFECHRIKYKPTTCEKVRREGGEWRQEKAEGKKSGTGAKETILLRFFPLLLPSLSCFPPQRRYKGGRRRLCWSPTSSATVSVRIRSPSAVERSLFSFPDLSCSYCLAPFSFFFVMMGPSIQCVHLGSTVGLQE